MSRKRTSGVAERRVLDRIAGTSASGALVGLMATTFELQPEFVEGDFLPTVLGLGAWDDRSWTARIELERHLAAAEGATILMQANRYRDRPRSMRLAVHPWTGRAKLHAKVALVVHERAMRLVVGSANLTEPGYRRNREVVAILDAARPTEAALMRAALEGYPEEILSAWGEDARRVRALALLRLEGTAPDPNVAFAWSGPGRPLWRALVDRWPRGERVQRIRVVSPFWSDDGEGGALARLLAELRERDALADGAEIELVTEAETDTEGRCRPVIPASVLAFDPRRFGARGVVRPVDPLVGIVDVGPGVDLGGTRALHAKVVVLEGPTTAVAYAGSANFTHQGFGFAPNANLEAGLLMTGRPGQPELLALIPPTKDPIPLGTGDATLVSSPKLAADDPWPSFVEALVLECVAGEWTLHVKADPTASGWWAHVPDRAQDVITRAGAERARPLDIATAYALLSARQLIVCWPELPQGRPFPLSVAPSARDELPLAPGGGKPSEAHLLDYYLGRISLEEVFEASAPREEQEGQGTEAVELTVDTSRIQSYQVRAFVEALQGIRDDLARCVVTASSIALALRGAVSPVALAREIAAAVRAGVRSPVAGGFQLVELLACLDEAARREVPPELVEPWRLHLGRARDEVRALLDELRSAHPELGRAPFNVYAERVGAHFGGRA